MGLGGNWNQWTSPTRNNTRPTKVYGTPVSTPSSGNRGAGTTTQSGSRQTHAPWAPTTDAAGFRAAIGYYPGNPAYNPQAYAGYLAGATGGLPPGSPAAPGGNSGGGGRGGGGGGGGGGAVGMTQAMFDAMVQALGRQGQPLGYTPLNLPAFQGQNIAAFNATPYTQAQQQLNAAVRADRQNAINNAQNTTNALNANYRNDYANQTVTPGVTQAPMATNLQATAGPALSGDANQQAAAGVNAANGDSQAAFKNLLGVLAANANQSEASRLNQVQMDRGTALNAIGAQQLGLGAGINQARAQAQTQWQQQDNERRYQNSVLAQQWAREQAMQNNTLANQTAQSNWQQQNQQLASTLQPILDLIGAGRGLNMQTLMQLLGRGQPALPAGPRQ